MPTAPGQNPPEQKPAEISAPATKPAEAPAAPAAKPAETPPPQSPEAKPAAAPAEAPPAGQPAPAAEAPAEAPVPEFNYEELARPSVAQRLKLTDEQKQKITALLSERADALAKAPEDQKPAVRKQSDRQLASALSEEQMKQFAQQQAEPRLRFNFRFQRWADVLEWFAEQADLSLVIDAPPPGTFNYSDTRDYTPSEAIDLLNSVLHGKGYTLIRRDRMLIVVDLNQGIPEDMIPRVEVGELESRGKFELVSTLFPLEGRDAELVEKEIKPLLGPHGKSMVLPATKQVLVTATAGAMQAIRKVIEAVPVPQKPQPKPEHPPEKPELAVHPVGNADPQAAMEVLKALFAGANIVLDPKTSQINAYVGASQQAAIKKVLETLQGGLPEEKRPRLEVYTVDQPGADQLVATLKTMVPEAQLSIDPSTGKLVVWANTADQETIKTTLEKLRGLGSPDQTRQLQVYRLTRVDPANAQTLLASLVPAAKLSVDTRTRSLIALATPADHATIKSTLDQLQPGEEGATAPELRLYPMDEMPSAGVLSALSQLVPDVQVTPEPEKKRLMVVATPAEHEVIKKTLDQAAASPADARQLVAYSLDAADPTSALTMLQGLMPGVQLVLDPKTNRLLAWARPSEHEAIKSALLQIQAGASPESQPRFEIYPIQKSQASQILTTLQTLVPSARLSLDPQNEKLVAWGTPSDHRQIQAAIEKLQVAVTPETTPQLEVYRLTKADPTTVVTLLQSLVPDAKLTVDASSRTLVALAVPEDHQTIRATLEQLQSGERPPDAPELRYYTLKQQPPATLIPGLQTLAPKAQVTLSEDGLRLMVIAPPSEHEILQKTLDEIALVPDDARQVVAYPLESADPSSTITMLQGLMPGVQIVLDPKANRLLAFARPSEQEKIKSALAQIQSDTAPTSQPRFEVYAVPKTQASQILTTLQTLVPAARLSLDPKSEKLVAWGTPSDHQQIRTAIEKLQVAVTMDTTPQLEVHRLTKADPTATVTVLQSLVPDAKLSVDTASKSLVALAVPGDQQIIRAMLEQLQSEKDYQLVAYPIKAGDPNAILTTLQGVFPGVQFTLDKRSRRIMAFTRPEQQEAIKAAIEQMDSAVPAESQESLKTYPVSRITPQLAMQILQERVPDANLIHDTTANKIIARAIPADHKLIAEILQQMQSTDETLGPKLVVYPTGDLDPTALSYLLRTLVPAANVVVDSKTGGLAAWATPEDHKTIQATIDEMSKGEIAGEKPVMATYALETMTAADAMRILATAVPKAQLSPGADAQQLVAWAKPADQKILEQLLQQLAAKGPPETSPRMETYDIGKLDSTRAMYALRAMAPSAIVSPGVNPGQMIAWGRPADHKKIQEALAKLADQGPPENAPSLVVYPLDKVTASSAMAVLQTVAPQAQLSVGSTPNQLVAYARPADHEVIKNSLAQIDVEDPQRQASKVVVYTLKGRKANGSIYTLMFLRSAVPNATFTLGSDPSQLVVWAKPEDHEMIKQLVDQFSKELPPEETPTAEIYTIGPGTNASSAMQVLSTAVPEANLSVGSDPQQLVAFAKPADHKKIDEIIKKLSAGEPAETAPSMVVYPLANVQAQDAIRLLSTIVPQAKLNTGSDPKQLVAYARPADHELIKTSLAQIDTEDGKATAQVYQLKGKATYAGSYYTLAFLRTAVPEATFAVGADSAQLVVWARPEQHERIKALVEQLSKDLPPEEMPTTVVYTLSNGTAASSAISMLSTAVPEARLSMSSDPQKLIAYAKPADHKIIQEMVDKLSAAEPAETAPAMVVYPLKNVQAQDAIRLLSTIVPQAKLNTGSDPKQLVAYARPADHELIKTSLAQIDTEDGKATAEVYQLKGKATYAGSYYTLAFLRTAVPEATFAVGADSAQLVVWARPEQHERIKALVEQLSKDLPPEEMPTTVVYTLSNGTAASSAISMLSTAVPEARLSMSSDPQKLIAYAKPADHKIIQEMVDKLSAAEPAETAPALVIYPLNSVLAQDAIRVLNTIVPQAKLNPGSDPRQLVAYARPADHEAIKASLVQIDREDQKATAVVYTLKGRSVRGTSYLYQFLTEAVPDAEFTRGSDPNQLVVWAKPETHEKVKQLVEQLTADLPPEEMPTTKVYTLGSGMTASGALPMLTMAAPDASFAPSSDPQKLTVFATPAGHKIIEDAIQKMSAAEPAETAPTMVVYPLTSVQAQDAIRMLTTIVPQAKLNSGTDPRQLVAYARPADHDVIKASLAQIDREDQQAKAVVYTLKGRSGRGSSYYLYQFLTEAVPDAEFTRGADPNQLVVWAKPETHEKVKQLVEQMTTELPPGEAPAIAVYTVENTPVQSAISVLSSAFPDVSFSPGSDSRTVIAWAKPEEHKKIEAAVNGLSQGTSVVDQRTMAVYPLQGSDAASLMQVLQPVIRDHAQITSDPNRNSLIVWADKQYHEAIKKTIEEFTQQVTGMQEVTSRVYRFQAADPQAAYIVLQTLVPKARIALDDANRSLVVSAMPEDHQKIQATVEEMDREDQSQAPRLEVYPLAAADPDNLMTALMGLYRRRGDVQVSLDRDNGSIIAFASPQEHKKIRELVDQVEKLATGDTAARMQLFSLKNIDSDAALEVLTELMDKQGAKVRLSVEPRSEQLVAFARPEQQKLIESTLEQMRGEEPQFEIFQLNFVDPITADLAISRLFSDDYWNAPDIDVDPVTQQLFVRGKPDQLQQIRQLLIKMGETGLAVTPGAANSNLRTIRFSGDVQAAVAEIQRVWPQLRSNAIQVFDSAGAAPASSEAVNPSRETAVPASRLEKNRQAEPDKPEIQEKQSEKAKQDTDAAKKAPDAALPAQDKSTQSVSPWRRVFRLASFDPPATEQAGSARPAEKVQTPPAQALPVQQPSAEKPPVEPGLPGSSPVIIMPGDGQITIASDDPEALDQLESLLRSLTQPSGEIGRNFHIFPLKHTNAFEAAETVQELFRENQSRYGWRRGMSPVVVVPDERLNAILVQANRTDRATIENLLKVIDTDEVPVSPDAHRPRIIPIRNTDAERIEDVVQDVFRSQLGGSQRRSREGGSARWTPQVTVDEATNSLVIMAAAPLVDDITELVQSLDETAGSDPARTVTLVPLKKTNAGRVQESLEQIFRGGRSGRRR